MISTIVLSTLLNLGEIVAIPTLQPKIEARKRGKSKKGRKRGGNGLR